MRSFDVATFVAFGAAQLGVAGSDVLMEFDYPDLYAPVDLRVGRCRIAVAEPAAMVAGDDPARWSHVRIATKYPEIARRHFAARGVQAECIKLSGAVELAPMLGLCRRIVDLVSTGATLKAHDLVEVEHIADVTSGLSSTAPPSRPSPARSVTGSSASARRSMAAAWPAADAAGPLSEPPLPGSPRIVNVTLDEHTVVRRSPEVEHRAGGRHLRPARGKSLRAAWRRPRPLPAAPRDRREPAGDRDRSRRRRRDRGRGARPQQLPQLIKDYFTVCESYYAAIKRSSPARIEAIDMGRRGLHDEGAELLRQRLADRIDIDFATARRLFTLICVLHVRG